MRMSARARKGTTALLAAATGITGTVLGLGATSAEAATAVLDRRLSSPSIVESSGLARSTYDRDILWTHNDSGGTKVVYAVGSDSQTKARVTLGGASFRDWEDIAAGPGNQMYVGDIGDNRKARTSIQVYRFLEPSKLIDQTVPATRYDLVYPDGPHNAEGLMVHPVSGRVYVVTKSPSGGAVYAAPSTLKSGAVNKMTKVMGGLPIKLTAAAFTPDGSGFVVCNYSTAFRYDGFGDSRATVFDKPSLQQGESLEVTQGGAVLMGSEGTNSPVFRVSMP